MSRLTILIAAFYLSSWSASVQAQLALDREPPGPSSRRTGLVITEILYNPRPVPELATNLTLEFIELFNSKPWDEDISGFAIAGEVSYVFPPQTILGGGGYLVVARVPELIQSTYVIPNVVGPWDGAETNRLSTERGTIQLRNRQGAVLLEINYADSPPWPEGADGTGHSLVLGRPSLGEDNPRAWMQSDQVGGSPGGADLVTPEPLAAVVINEWLNHSDPADWIELYNHGNTPVTLSGAWLSDDPTTNKFRIPNGTIIPPRGFLSYDQFQLGFELFAGGETIFFWNPDQTRVLDVVDFRGQSNNVSSGRWPDGGPLKYGLDRPTRGGANSVPARYPVVISEIMYNPVSGRNDDEYVEIHNRTGRAVDLSGWEFIIGISHLFLTNDLTKNMPAGAYWVLAKNPTNLMSIYPNLNTNNTFGPYGGTLANGGERIVLAAADYDRVTGGGTEVMERLNVPIGEVTYADGGWWGNWSDGQGSSLELIDMEADTQHVSNWADSDDTSESLWTAIEATVALGETLGTPVNDRLIVTLEGIGECLLDELEVRVGDGPNLVVHGGFEEGLSGWTLQGSHDFSTIEETGFVGNRSLHVRAASRGDNQSNRILSAPLTEAIPAEAGTVSIRAKAKWLRGHSELLLRLHGSATEAYGEMALPRKLGTPGMANSRRVGNAGPAVYEVGHRPVLPAGGEEVVVTARATDRQGVTTLNLLYRVDPDPAYTSVPMRDDGLGADAIATDGIYSAAIPGQAEGTMVAFYAEGRDNAGAVGTFPKEVFPPPGMDRCWPNDAVARECVVRWGEVQMPGDFATYHLWVTSANSNRWHVRNAMNNTPMDGTFVYNNTRVLYNALPLFSGSPWHRANATNGPAGPNRVDYEMNFPDDDPLLGATDFVLNNSGNPNVDTISDLSAMTEQTIYQIFEGMGMTHNQRRYVHVFVNGSQRSTAHERPGNFIFEDSQQPNGTMIEEWFPTGAGGSLFKVEDWFEFENNGYDVAANRDADLVRRTVLLDGQPTLAPAPYRYMFRKRSVNVGASAEDYSELFALLDAVSPADNPTNTVIDPVAFGTVADWEQWMRFFAIERAVGNWDSYGWERGKNAYLYRSADGFVFMPWDIDYGLGLGRGAEEPLFASKDPRVQAMLNTPEIVRAYWRGFTDLVNGPFSRAYLDPFIDARTTALVNNNINIDLEAVAGIKAYIGDRQAFLQTQLDTVVAPFAVEGPPSWSTTNNLVVLTGTAPVSVKTIALNGVPYPVSWVSVTNFQLRLVLGGGVNALVLQGLDRLGAVIDGVTQTLSVDYTGPVVDPAEALVINEIMASPATLGAQFIEILNQSELNFDLSGWRLEGVNLTFPPGSIVTNRQILVLAQNRVGFRAAYGTVPVFAVVGGSLRPEGMTLGLIRPGPLGEERIDVVRYEEQPPWPTPMVGASLQLVDADQDNRRPSNWVIEPGVPASPGAPNGVATTLPAYDPLWLNEVQTENAGGPVDNAGDRDPWIELYNAGLTPASLEGYYLADNFTSNLTQHAFPAGTSLEPGSTLVVWADGEPEETVEGQWHTGFRLDYSGTLALVRLVQNQPQITDYLRWTMPGPNASYGDYPDGQPIDRFRLLDPTLGGTNLHGPLAVRFNEYLARNVTKLIDPTDGDADDWFELYNGEEWTVDLGGFHLSDNLTNPTRYRIPDNGRYRLGPGGYLLAWADGETTQNGANRPDLHVGFQLGGGGGVITLYAPDGQTLIDILSYGQQTIDLSEGRYTDGAGVVYPMPMPTPRTQNVIPGYNTPPVFPTLTNLACAPGQRLTVDVGATDPDRNALIHTLENSPPTTEMRTDGVFRWIVPTNQPPGDYLITVRATDNGTPPRSATGSFIFTVTGEDTGPVDGPAPVIASIACPGGQITFTIATVPGRTYRVFYKDDLSSPDWIQLHRDFVAANPTASLTDMVTGPQRFYRVFQVD